MAMLEVKNLEVYYGVIQAIKGISFEVNEGEVIALIGANGAGKTTTLQTITGMLQPKAGEIIFEGKDISKIPGHKIVSMGMAHVPEGRRVFAELSVYENLKLGAYTRKDKKDRGDIGTCIQELPASGGAEKPACRNTERWRTADACYGTCTDVKAEDHFNG